MLVLSATYVTHPAFHPFLILILIRPQGSLLGGKHILGLCTRILMPSLTTTGKRNSLHFDCHSDKCTKAPLSRILSGGIGIPRMHPHHFQPRVTHRTAKWITGDPHLANARQPFSQSLAPIRNFLALLRVTRSGPSNISHRRAQIRHALTNRNAAHSLASTTNHIRFNEYTDVDSLLFKALMVTWPRPSLGFP
jgi:hypothetical protein